MYFELWYHDTVGIACTNAAGYLRLLNGQKYTILSMFSNALFHMRRITGNVFSGLFLNVYMFKKSNK